MKNFSEFEEKIGVEFKNKDLLKQAFTHRSYLNEHPRTGLSHNERLEFLGDAVLELAVTDYLYDAFPNETEGELTSYRAALVNTTSLSRAAQDLNMNKYLLLSKGEAKDTGKAREYILANTFESVLGAIYLDRGHKIAEKFVRARLVPYMEDVIKHRLWQDAKSHFQEEAQERVGATPSYKVLGEVGPDHEKEFTVGVFLKTEIVAEGQGRSKQDAEQEAARKALQAKGWAK
ncbi:MAG: ribonuclease III [Patescibacteria group bacterium]